MAEDRRKSDIPISFTISCPGKIVLFGEEGIKLGYNALVASLDLRTHLTFRETKEDDFLKVELPDIKIEHVYNFKDIQDIVFSEHPPLLRNSIGNYNWEKPEMLNVAKIVEDVSEFLKVISDTMEKEQEHALLAFFVLLKGILCGFILKTEPFTIKITSEVAAGQGTGSSASYCSCLAAAFLYYIRLIGKREEQAIKKNKTITKKGYKSLKYKETDLNKFSDEEKKLISHWCSVCENIFHIHNSGASSEICVMGGIINFSTQGPGRNSVKSLTNFMRLDVLLIDTGDGPSRDDVKAKISSYRQRYPAVMKNISRTLEAVVDEVEDILLELGNLSNQKESLERNVAMEFESARFCEMVRLSRSIEFGMSLNIPTVDDLSKVIMNDYNLETAKLSHGGRGYCVIFLTPGVSTKKLTELKSYLRDEEYPYYHTRIGGQGITINGLD